MRKHAYDYALLLIYLYSGQPKTVLLNPKSKRHPFRLSTPLEYQEVCIFPSCNGHHKNTSLACCTSHQNTHDYLRGIRLQDALEWQKNKSCH